MLLIRETNTFLFNIKMVNEDEVHLILIKFIRREHSYGQNAGTWICSKMQASDQPSQ